MITSKKSISIFSKRNQRFFFLFLYNFHVCEYDSIFIFLRNQSYHLRSTSYGALLGRIFFYGKLEHFVEVFANDFQTILWLFKNPFMHYVRYQGKFLIASKGVPLAEWLKPPTHNWRIRRFNSYWMHANGTLQ